MTQASTKEGGPGPAATHWPDRGQGPALWLPTLAAASQPLTKILKGPEHQVRSAPGDQSPTHARPSFHHPNIWTCSGEPLISGNFFPHLICLFKENKLLLIRRLLWRRAARHPRCLFSDLLSKIVPVLPASASLSSNCPKWRLQARRLGWGEAAGDSPGAQGAPALGKMSTQLPTPRSWHRSPNQHREVARPRHRAAEQGMGGVKVQVFSHPWRRSGHSDAPSGAHRCTHEMCKSHTATQPSKHPQAHTCTPRGVQEEAGQPFSSLHTHRRQAQKSHCSIHRHTADTVGPAAGTPRHQRSQTHTWSFN